ncbi:MAG: pyrroline-5-carboxylate reductase [Candidatus Helarchaeota archaeon]|nr:pyrroline-5-carboxylate reductase [Candidatus Helarchaeota archaeon]
MDIQNKNIGVIGTGNMGESIIRGLIQFAKLNPTNVHAADIDEKKLNAIKDQYKIKTYSNNKNLLNEVDIVLIAVKPQQIEEVLHEISTQDKKYILIISVAAGIKTSLIEKSIGKEISVIRVMPNICATVNAAVSALCKGKHATDESFHLATTIFKSIGQVVEVKEELMDVVTGLSGSGPAYIFLAIEALSDAGVELGLTRDISTILAVQTTLGAAKMILDTGDHPSVLRDKVTSPGGTTIRGLAVLEEQNFRAALIDAVKAATERSRELSSQKKS